MFHPPFPELLAIPTNKSVKKFFTIEQYKVPSRLHLEKHLAIPNKLFEYLQLGDVL